MPLSLVNDTAPTLAPPPQYRPRDFPFGAHDAFDLRDADLLALAMRLIYEREEVFQVRRRCPKPSSLNLDLDMRPSTCATRTC